MANFVPMNRSTSNVTFVLVVIFRRKRPRFASFFFLPDEFRQKSKPRLIRFFSARLIKWRHLPSWGGCKLGKSGINRIRWTGVTILDHKFCGRVYVIKFLEKVTNLFLFFLQSADECPIPVYHKFYCMHYPLGIIAKNRLRVC